MPEVKDKMTGKTVAQMSYDEKGMDAANKMVANDPGLVVTDGRNRSQQMYEGGGMTGMSMIGRPQYREGGKMKYMGGGKTHGMKKMGDGGMMKKYEDGGKTLKEVDSSKNPGLSKLPKEVRNKMGYMEEGGKTKADFKPHMMYKDGKGVKANTYEKHMSLKKQGYGHSMKKMKEGGKTKDGPSFFGGDFFKESGRKRRQERRKARKEKKVAMEKKRQSELKKIKQRKSKTAITAGSKSKTKFGAAKVTKSKTQIAKEKAAKKAAANESWKKAVKARPKGGPTMNTLIKARGMHKKGSATYNKIQNEINKRYGVKKRHSVPETKKTTKTKTAKSKIKSSKPSFLVSPRLTVPKIGPKLEPKLNK